MIPVNEVFDIHPFFDEEKRGNMNRSPSNQTRDKLLVTISNKSSVPSNYSFHDNLPMKVPQQDDKSLDTAAISMRDAQLQEVYIHSHFLYLMGYKKDSYNGRDIGNKMPVAMIDLLFRSLTVGKDSRGNDVIILRTKTYGKKLYTCLLQGSTPEKNKQLFQILKGFCIQASFQKFYRVDREIFNGNNAKVNRLISKRNNLNYVEKVFEKVYAFENKKAYELIRNEIVISKMLNHPSIITFSELYDGDRNFHCVSDYYSGGRLFDAMRDYGPFTEEFALYVLKQLLLALLHMHEKNVMHRDIKLENIMFRNTDRDSIVVVDLGYAYFSGGGLPINPQCGTPGYTAPEVFTHSLYNKNIDVFSSGIVFYRLLTNQCPFKRSSSDDVLRNNRNGNVHLNLEAQGFRISSPSIYLLEKMLQKNSNARYSVADCLNHQAFTLVQSPPQCFVGKKFLQSPSRTPKSIISESTNSGPGPFRR